MEPTTERRQYSYAKGEWKSKPSITAGEAVAFLESIKGKLTAVPSKVNAGVTQTFAWQIFYNAAKAIGPTHAIHSLVFKNIKHEFGHFT